MTVVGQRLEFAIIQEEARTCRVAAAATNKRNATSVTVLPLTLSLDIGPAPRVYPDTATGGVDLTCMWIMDAVQCSESTFAHKK